MQRLKKLEDRVGQVEAMLNSFIIESSLSADGVIRELFEHRQMLKKILGIEIPREDDEEREDKLGPEAADDPSDEEATPLPTVFTTYEPPPTRDQEIKTRAAHFKTDVGREYREQVEAYRKIKDNPTKRHSMLQLFLEIEHGKNPMTSFEDVAMDFQMTDDAIEEMLQLDLDLAAVEWLRSRGN